ncbi:MAG: tetratricopeptide repeat protein [Acidobacteria bacterium]|nr:tetratricopeptide repeat protein [Acidobacteriota bacterium]
MSRPHALFSPPAETTLALVAGLQCSLLLSGWTFLMTPGGGSLAPDPLALGVWLAGLILGLARVNVDRRLLLPLVALGPALAFLAAALLLRIPAAGVAATLLQLGLALSALAPCGYLAGRLLARDGQGVPERLWLGVAAGTLVWVLAPGPWQVVLAFAVAPVTLLLALARSPWVPSRRMAGDEVVDPPASTAAEDLAQGAGVALVVTALVAWGQILLLLCGNWPAMRLTLPFMLALGGFLGVRAARRWGRRGRGIWLLTLASLWNLAAAGMVGWVAWLVVGMGAARTPRPLTAALLAAGLTILPLTLFAVMGWTLQATGQGDRRVPRQRQVRSIGALIGLTLALLFLGPALGVGRLLVFAAAALPLGVALPTFLGRAEASFRARRVFVSLALLAASLSGLVLTPVDVRLLAAGAGWNPHQFAVNHRPALPATLGRLRLLGTTGGPNGLVAARETSDQHVDLAWQGWSLGREDRRAAVRVAAALPVMLAPQARSAGVVGDRAGYLTKALLQIHPDLEVARYEVLASLDTLQPAHDDLFPRAAVSPWALGGPYDILLMQPLPAHVVASGAAWSRQALDRARTCLAPGGLVALRLEAGQLSVQALYRSLRTFNAVFPAATLWFDGQGLVLLGARDHLVVDLPAFERRFRRAAGALHEAGMNRPVDLLARYLMSARGMAKLVGGVKPETRFWPRLAFADPAAAAGSHWPDTLLTQRAKAEDLLSFFPGLESAARENLLDSLGREMQATLWWLRMLAAASGPREDGRETLALHRKALEFGGAALELRPRDAALKRALAAAVFRAAGETLAAGLQDDAMVLLERAAKLDPQRVEYQVEMYGLSLARRAGASAQRRLSALALRFPASYPVLLAQADRRLDQSDIDAGEAFLRRAADTGFDTAALHLGLARVAIARGRMDAGRSHVAHGVRMAPDKALALADIGGSLVASQSALARTYLSAALDLGNRRVEVLGPLGQLAREQGDYGPAIDLFTEAVAAAPERARLRLELGSTLLVAGRSSEALEHLRRAEELAPGDAIIRLNLAVALVKEGRMDEARRHLDAMGERLVDNPVYQSLRRRLQPAAPGGGTR